MDFDLTDEQRAWQRTLHAFVAKEVRPKAHEVDETGEFNWTAVRKGAPVGLLGLSIPEKYGGAEMDAISAAIAIQELGWACGSTALALAAHNGLGTAPLVNYGSEGLKQLQLVAEKGELARGEAKFYLAKDYSRPNEHRAARFGRQPSQIVEGLGRMPRVPPDLLDR